MAFPISCYHSSPLKAKKSALSRNDTRTVFISTNDVKNQFTGSLQACGHSRQHIKLSDLRQNNFVKKCSELFTLDLCMCTFWKKGKRKDSITTSKLRSADGMRAGGKLNIKLR